MVEGEWSGRITGLGTQCVEIAMMVTPDGSSSASPAQAKILNVIYGHLIEICYS